MTGIAVCLANAPRQLPTAHAVEAGGVLDPERRHIYPVCEESGALVTQLSEPPIPDLTLRAAS